MNYGFLIDNRTCIGCHACSTACKSENEVPLGVHRTWVRYTEVGTYPDVRRNFQVNRCNHCANPPCARICPVTAMYQRDDGIVEFDPDACIGCKACLQACPYDAIHIDPDTGTAAKCHFCAHRVEVSLEPACVVVCPTHSIVAGDLDDPESEIRQRMAASPVTVRKPEQGTAPKLFYVDGHATALDPLVAQNAETGHVFGEVIDPRAEGELEVTLGEQGLSFGGPIHVESGRIAEQMVQVAWNAQHEVPWHWQVPAYLITKAIASGIFLLLAFYVLIFGASAVAYNVDVTILGGVGVLMTLATTALLVFDLERPERFLRILLRPQWGSWLARGAFILVGFSVVSGLWWLSEMLSLTPLQDATEALRTPRVRVLFAALLLPLSTLTAIYTAFLLAQAEGRDLWQSGLLPIRFFVQAVVLGSAVVYAGTSSPLGLFACGVFFLSLMVHLPMLVVGEFGVSHASEVAARAAHDMRHGRYRKHVFWGGVFLGHVVPLMLLFFMTFPALLGGALIAMGPVKLLAPMCCVIGFYLYEYAFIMAPQHVPNS